MKFIADLHIHSKYSRATSKNMDIEHITRWAKLKGIDLVGTGDFTHPVWFEELKGKLKPTPEGLLEYNGIKFIPTAEVSNMYSKNGSGRRIHTIIFAPDLEREKSDICREFRENSARRLTSRPVLVY